VASVITLSTHAILAGSQFLFDTTPAAASDAQDDSSGPYTSSNDSSTSCTEHWAPHVYWSAAP
jgi:hypothetical protein